MVLLARFPIRWNHLIEKNSRQFKNLGNMSLSEKRVIGGKARRPEIRWFRPERISSRQGAVANFQ
jgi:hypothetical protein